METRFNPSPKVRQIIYIISSIASYALTYLLAKGLIGDPEFALVTGLIGLANTLAAVNTDTTK